MKKSSQLGYTLLVALWVALFVPALASAQLLPAFEKEKDETWKWSFGLLWGETSEELLNTSHLGFILRGPDVFANHSFLTEAKVRHWHPHWSVFYMKADGGASGGGLLAQFQESEIYGFLFGSDYVMPGRRHYFTGGLGLYNVVSTRQIQNSSGDFDLSERSDLDVGGYLGLGFKLGTSRLWTVELCSHYFKGNSILTFGTNYRW